MRDRLIELLKETRCERDCYGFKNAEACKGCTAYEKYAESADNLLANGVMCLPCTLGEKVYRISKKGSRRKYIEETTISRIAIDKEGIWLFCSCNSIAKCVWGKTVFASREEAEKALRKEDVGK